MSVFSLSCLLHCDCCNAVGSPFRVPLAYIKERTSKRKQPVYIALLLPCKIWNLTDRQVSLFVCGFVTFEKGLKRAEAFVDVGDFSVKRVGLCGVVGDQEAVCELGDVSTQAMTYSVQCSCLYRPVCKRRQSREWSHLRCWTSRGRGERSVRAEITLQPVVLGQVLVVVSLTMA